MSSMLRGHVGLMTAMMLGALEPEPESKVFTIHACPEEQEKWERERERRRRLSQEDFLREEQARREKIAAPFREERARRKAGAWEKRQPKKKGQSKVASSFLKQIAFPECGRNCAALEMLGVCECESICGWKFHPCDEGQSRKSLTQKELDELHKG